MYQQLSLFDFIPPEKSVRVLPPLLQVGDKIGRVILGECRIAPITEIEGLPNYPFYRTDSGTCYSLQEGQENINHLLAIAEKEREKYTTFIPKNLKERITVEYSPRICDGKIIWAQIGIIDNMLFWKEDITYQFLEPYENTKKLKQAYEKHKYNILQERHGRIVQEEKQMRRLYWSRHGFYADAEYVETNG